jgi:hypothetical protein
MTVLKIIGFIAFVLLLYWLVISINSYSYKKYKYEFFNMQNFVTTAIGYAFLFFGNNWYMNAVKANGDLLNGGILIGIGAVTVLYVVYINIKRTDLLFGLFFTLFQLVLYVALTLGAAFALLIVMAALSETKPVYNLNK